ncbi:TonB-dependent receptor domain-containing protein [Dyadobacter subterraneus]|uniref:TonB-dependent receptor n=1 Tax=Dyadobacter subterraneus TaxID=2773304 RepID=A0ABR9WEB4_9BACT|nr:outer membrane beta-barrel family protein [Dyadobacter subterraneus]MBE9463830.1 TonB-dependent receptor [Dyadobacter subterraneus]
MRLFVLISIWYLFTNSGGFVSAQSSKVRGKIVENTKEAGLGFASVSLVRLPDSLTVSTQFTNGEGGYAFEDVKPGSYLITASFIGYEKGKSASFEISATDLTVRTLMLITSTNTLSEFTVKGNKPLLEKKIDRMVFNLSNSLAAKGTDLIQALAWLPMLKVQESEISIIGKGGVSVMINERIVQLRGNELVNYLKTLRSDDIEKIEIITTPPAKYEAQGTGGLINIVLKKNQSLGWRGSLGTSYSQNNYPSYANNLALFFRSKKLRSSLTFNQSKYRYIIKESFNITGRPSEIISDEKRIGNSPGLQTGISIDYELNKHNNIGLIYNISDNKSNTTFGNSYSFITDSIIDSVLNTTGKFSRPLFAQTLNIYHDLKLDSAGKKLSSSVNFFMNKPEMRNDFISESENTYVSVQNNNLSKYNIWSVQSDLTLPYNWAKIETGIKLANFNNNANVEYYNYTGEGFFLDKTRSNEFNYTESNLASYFSMESELSERWSAKAGLRYEYTLMDGYSPTLDQRNRRNYGALFPTAYIVYKAGKNHVFSLNYSRRINRPSLNSLNPFAYYTNIYTYSTGNPLLLPSYSNNVEVNYLYKGMFSFTVFTQHTSDIISNLTTVNGPSLVTSRGNFLTQDNLGAYLSFNRSLSKWWENSVYVSFLYASPKSKIAAIRTPSGTSASFSINNSFNATTLLSFYLNYNQNLPSTDRNVYTYTQRSFRMGARIKLLDNNLIISPAYFLGTVSKYDFHYSEFVQTTKTDYNYNTFTLSLSYSFGRSKVSGNNKDIRFDEKRRAQ